MDYGEGFAMTGFYVALNEDNGAGMAGFPRRRCCAPCPGYGSVAPVSAAPPGRYTPHSKKPRTFRDGVLFKRKNKKPGLSTELSALFDAWQFMAGVLPVTLRAVAAQRSNPLPADLSCSGERSPTDNRQNKKPSLSTELFV
ncbi:hypothetical protein N5J21_22145, partial [Klebsiella quasipneumoniae]|uniref:hypothetical protein n=1 Tax=Klebsiella quasipneumoniae TaxID=1463165 RepID=UPI00244B085F